MDAEIGTIRRREPGLPVIVVTAQSAVEQRVERLDRGASDYVTKLFSIEERLARVRAQLRGPSAAATPWRSSRRHLRNSPRHRPV